MRDDEDEAFARDGRFFFSAPLFRVLFGPRGGRGPMDGSGEGKGGAGSSAWRARGGTRGWTRVDRRVKGLTANARGRRDSRATRRRKRRRRRSIEAFDSVRGGVGRRRYVIRIGARGYGSGRSIPRKRRRGRTTRRRDNSRPKREDEFSARAGRRTAAVRASGASLGRSRRWGWGAWQRRGHGISFHHSGRRRAVVKRTERAEKAKTRG